MYNFAIYNINYINVKEKYYSLKDFELSNEKNAIERANSFQLYINQLNAFGYKSYWAILHTGIGATMKIDGIDKNKD